MKRMRSHPTSRWLARLLALLILTPYALVGGGMREARAQQGKVPTVYVLDFNNNASIGGACCSTRMK